MTLETVSWFKSNVVYWKSFYAIRTLLLIQFVFTLITIFLLQFTSWLPFSSGLGDTFITTEDFSSSKGWTASFVSLSAVLYHFLQACLVVFFAVCHVYHLKVSPTVHQTRLHFLWFLLSPHRFLYMLLTCFVGATLVRCLLAESENLYSTLVIKCNEGVDCGNEFHVFIVLHGAFKAFVCYWQNHLQQRNYVEFPIVQQLKSHQIRSQLGNICRTAFGSTVKQVYIFYILYYIFGSAPRNWIGYSLGINAWTDPDLTTLHGLFDIHLLWFIICTGTLLHVVFECTFFLVQVFMTEQVKFPIDVEYEQEKKHSLKFAMESEEYPLLQYFGFFDFCCLAKHSQKRRADVFKISNPGGHPVHWTALAEICLKLVENFITSLNFLYTPSAPVPVTEGKQHSNGTLSSVSPRMRRIVSEQPQNMETNKEQVPTFGSTLLLYVKSKLTQVLNNLKQKPLIGYFLSDLPDAKGRKLFADCQPLVWAVDGLCFVVCASYTEDKYGVVQILLPKIISSLLELDMALDRYSRRSTTVRKYSGIISGTGRELQLRQSLRMSVSSGLYRIVKTFGGHLWNIPMTEEHLRKLKQFAEFKA